MQGLFAASTSRAGCIGMVADGSGVGDERDSVLGEQQAVCLHHPLRSVARPDHH